MKKSTFIYIGIGVIGLAIIAYLGKKELPTKFEIKKDQTFWIYGKPYEGKIDKIEFAQLFDNAEKVIKNQSLKASAGAIYTIDPTENRRNYVTAFIGIISNDSIKNPSADLSLKKLHYPQILTATQESNRYFNNIFNQLNVYVEKNQLPIDSSTQIEIYLSEEKIMVGLPLKK